MKAPTHRLSCRSSGFLCEKGIFHSKFIFGGRLRCLTGFGKHALAKRRESSSVKVNESVLARLRAAKSGCVMAAR